MPPPHPSHQLRRRDDYPALANARSLRRTPRRPRGRGRQGGLAVSRRGTMAAHFSVPFRKMNAFCRAVGARLFDLAAGAVRWPPCGRGAPTGRCGRCCPTACRCTWRPRPSLPSRPRSATTSAPASRTASSRSWGPAGTRRYRLPRRGSPPTCCAASRTLQPAQLVPLAPDADKILLLAVRRAGRHRAGRRGISTCPRGR